VFEVDEIKVDIIPDKMIYNGELYDVVPADENCKNDLIVKKIRIHKKQGLLEKVILDCNFHPNCKPDTNEFCINQSLVGEEVNNITFSIICSAVSVYNMDRAYRRPWGKIIYEKCKSIKVKVEE